APSAAPVCSPRSSRPCRRPPRRATVRSLRSTTSDERAMSDDDTCTTDHTQWLDEIASGAHDDALVRLAAAAVAGAEPSAWDDPRFVEWWIARAQGAAARTAARLSDAQHLAAGRALRAVALARSVSVA